MPARDKLTTPRDVRNACRSGELKEHTSGLAQGFAQANLVILPLDDAVDFRQFCELNPKPCPLLEVTEPGCHSLNRLATDADLRTDLPMYRVWRDGELVEEVTDITTLWRDDLVSFLIGCSFTFEAALAEHGVTVRHVELGRNVPMFRTSLECKAVGKFHGPLVVSMRPLRPAQAILAIQITSQFPDVHGVPIHIGLPREIGIDDLQRPDFGEAVPIEADELPVFWACGVTPQAALMAAKPKFAITHSPGCMFVSDLKDDSLRRVEPF
ncbi:MAG: putative hydro-lyase [Planctomycetota bacterium]|nr:putative hydro-lyase [Planctomycetota bacterium]MDA1162739.1 putative hydro-lyase [Planctomycetota bacterium]